MKLLVLAHNLHTAGGLSVGVNVVNALDHLRVGHEIHCVVPADVGYPKQGMMQQLTISEYRIRGIWGRLKFETQILPKLIRDIDPDVVWALGNIPVRTSRFQSVLLQNAHRLYDASHAGPISFRNRIRRKFMDLQFSHRLRYVDLMFTQTETMRKRFMEAWPNGPAVELFPNSVSEKTQSSNVSFQDEPLPSTIRNNKLLFCLTRYYPHKNIESIVDCFDRYRSELEGITCLLTLHPSHGRQARNLLQRIERLGLRNQLVNLGPLDQSVIAYWYRRSHALMLPTLLESFSGTYVEAMNFDCPIMTSDLDFAREICGDAALYFNPASPSAMKVAIVNLTSDESLRAQLVQAGRKRIREITSDWNAIVATALQRIEENRLSS